MQRVFIMASLLCLALVGLVQAQYPDATNTGWQHTGVSLTPYSSPCTITTAGTVIDSRDITCSELIIRANNVTVKRSRLIMAQGGGPVFLSNPTNLSIVGLTTISFVGTVTNLTITGNTAITFLSNPTSLNVIQ